MEQENAYPVNSREGVELLGQAFPKSRIVGLDFASKAIEQATQRHPGHEFILSDNGAIPGEFDIIITSNCLEHFEYPLEVIRTHLHSCRSLYIALVPYNEFPLSEYHRSQFKSESFPERIGSCGGATTTLPFTDVMGNPFFCEIAEAFFSGLTNGTTPTTYSPTQNVPRKSDGGVHHSHNGPVAQAGAGGRRSINSGLRRAVTLG